jgi:hypothetical protein
MTSVPIAPIAIKNQECQRTNGTSAMEVIMGEDRVPHQPTPRASEKGHDC